MKTIITFSLVLFCTNSIFSSEETQVRPLSPNSQITDLQKQVIALQQQLACKTSNATTQTLTPDEPSCCDRECMQNDIENCCVGVGTFAISYFLTTSNILASFTTLYASYKLGQYQDRRKAFKHTKME